MRKFIFQCSFFCWLFAGGLSVAGQEATSAAGEDETTITAAVQDYEAAFNAKDVVKLVSLWSPNGVYMSRSGGESIVGHEALTASTKELFENNDNPPRIAVVTNSIDFVSPNVALVRNTVTITRASDVIDESDFKVVFVKQGGAWLIDRVAEEVIEPTHYEQLKVLDFLIGEWIVEQEGFRLEMSWQWTAKQNFISCQYKVIEDDLEASGLQVIGWDAKEKTIRSWLFDSDGGVVTGTWIQRNDGWSVPSVATLGQGESGSFTSVFRMQDDGTLTWEKINQVVDGKLLPNMDAIVFTRQ